MTDIHDIKPLLPAGTDLLWLWVALAVLAAAALALLAYRWWRRRRTAAEPAGGAAPAEPDAEAYALLDALAADNAVAGKAFYFQLSFILRRYLERRFAIPAAEMTTEELLPRVARLPLAADLAAGLAELCRVADPVKFADAAVDPRRLPQDLAFARDLVRRTTPAAAAADAPPADSTTRPQLAAGGAEAQVR